tara:strand:+ start:1055 stop:2554 length:1500 start_codon:yes stop_codon:yes gene_type:complete
MPISRSQMERQLRMGGGIMNIENRQKYLFGGITKSIKKAVKGVTNAAKKVVKSPLGKAAILGAVGFGIPGTSIGGLFGRGAAAPGMFNLFGSKGAGKYLYSPVQGSGSILGKIGLSGSAGKAALGIGAASTLAGILASDAEMTEEEAEELKQDPAALRNYLRLYYSNLNPNASKEEVDSFVRTNMYADGGRVNYQQGSQPAPAPAQPTQPGSLQGATSLYGDVVEYLKRQGRQSDQPDQPQMIFPGEIIGKGPATPYPFSGAGSFLGGGAINTPTPPAGGGSGTGILQTAPSAPTAPMPKPPSNVAPNTSTSKTSSGMYIDPTGTTMEEYFSKYTPYWQQRLYDELGDKEGEEYKAADKAYTQAKKDFDYSVYKAFGFNDYVPEDYVFGDIDTLTKNIASYNMRKGYRSGDVVDQASGIMGLSKRVNKAGVKELDLRKSGGFIPPVGVKEKADDIPAMLSNNEFVFTADAVRGMGNGNVNKGAQRMYDMMKKLEKGGRV